MKASYKFALRIWGYYAITMLLCLFFVFFTSGDALGAILNIALLFGMLALAVNEGGYRGEKACTLAATLEKQSKDGRKIDPELPKQVFHRSVAYKMLAIAIIPFLFFASLNMIVNPPRPGEPALAETQEEESALVEQHMIGTPEPAEEGPERAGSAFGGWVRAICMVLFMPYVFLYHYLSEAALYWLFFAFGIPFPLAGAIGYMMGPRLREKKLKDMMKGKRRKMRKLKVNQPPKKPKAVV